MKRKWLWILGGMCVAVALGFLVTLWYLSYKSLSMTIGRVLVAQNGTYMLIDGNSPIALSNRQKNDKLFEGLENGDKVWVLHYGIETTYPARTGAYAVWKLEDGDMDDIPKGVLDTLRELGWVAQVEATEPIAFDDAVTENPEGDDGVEETSDTTRVSASYGEHTLSISIPEGWEYEIKEYSDESSSFGIYFWPEGETEGKLSFLYYDAWGVCGTGLESETIEIGGYEASKGNYNGGIWEFICFQKDPGWCVIKNDTARAWLGKYMDEAMEIIDTVHVK